MAREPGSGGEVRLPWLDGEDERGRAGGLPLGWLAAGLVVLALAGGGAWTMLRMRHAAALVAEGGVIRAPAGPYKVRPRDPGGKLAEGTGDTSYAVAEGKPAGAMHLGGGADAVIDLPSASAGAAILAGVPVQIGAFASAADAEAQWPKLTQRYPSLAPLRHRVVESRADLGSVFGLQAMAPDAASADALCVTLRAGGLNCRVKA